MKKLIKSLNTLVYALSFIVLVISVPIAIVLLWRGFYYWHIDLLDITSLTGYTKDELIMSFDELMDSLIFYKPFGEGVFEYSESGMNHFLDCRILFTIDLIAAPISLVIFALYAFLIKFNFIKVYQVKNLSVLFFASFVPIIAFGALAIFALIDVDAAYAFFHAVLFPGKDNWLFNGNTDPIIYALPEQFFLDCGIFIFGLILIVLIGVIIFNIIRLVKYSSVRIYNKYDLLKRGVK